MLRYISASEAVMMLADEDEVAFLDIREMVPFGTGHPLLATNLPLSRMEFVRSETEYEAGHLAGRGSLPDSRVQ